MHSPFLYYFSAFLFLYICFFLLSSFSNILLIIFPSFLLVYLFFFCLMFSVERNLETTELQEVVSRNIAHSNSLESWSIITVRFVDVYSLCKSLGEVSAPNVALGNGERLGMWRYCYTSLFPKDGVCCSLETSVCREFASGIIVYCPQRQGWIPYSFACITYPNGSRDPTQSVEYLISLWNVIGSNIETGIFNSYSFVRYLGMLY